MAVVLPASENVAHVVVGACSAYGIPHRDLDLQRLAVQLQGVVHRTALDGDVGSGRQQASEYLAHLVPARERDSSVVLGLGLVPSTLYGQDVASQLLDHTPASRSVALALERPEDPKQLGVSRADEIVALGGENLGEAVGVSGFVEMVDVLYPLGCAAAAGTVPDGGVGVELLAQRLIH